MHTLRTSLTATCLLLLALPLGGQEKKEEKGHEMGGHEMAGADMAAMMEAYHKAGMPGEPHAALAAMAGHWTASVKIWMDPDGEPMVSEATLQSEMVMDGRFLHDDVKSEFMGQPFRGAGLLGYDNTSGRYQAIWVDNHSTTLYSYSGTMEGNTLTMTGKYKDPVTGDWVTSRSVRTLVSPDEMVDTGYEVRDGVERKTMEIVYKRQK
ncbi:MAG: DUF1579 domain-containing protein [Gemmatimonadota bacterium]